MFDLVFFVSALVAAFLAGAFVNSTTLKNYFTGVPSELQTALDGLKAKALAVHKATLAKATAAAKPAPVAPPPTPAAIATAAAVAVVTPALVVAPANPAPPATA